MSVDGAGFTEQPLRPARASDAPISARNCRRLTPSSQCGGPALPRNCCRLQSPPIAIGGRFAAGKDSSRAAPVPRCSANRASPRRNRRLRLSVRASSLSRGSSVACRATGDAGGILDLVLLDELLPQLELIAGRLVLHVEHFLPRADLPAGLRWQSRHHSISSVGTW